MVGFTKKKAAVINSEVNQPVVLLMICVFYGFVVNVCGFVLYLL
jgi:hypothetical protein